MPSKRTINSPVATGIIRIHPRGFGFLIPNNRDRFPDDIFIPRHQTKGAVDGDEVQVRLNIYSTSEKGPEGSIVKIINRGRSHLAGIIVYSDGKKQIYAFSPVLGEEKSMQILPSKERNLQVGDRIIIRVTSWGSKYKEGIGEMSEYIGHISEPKHDIRAALQEFELNDTFSEQTLSEAASFGHAVPLKDLDNRQDLRTLECLTIDPETAKDLDDALSLTQDQNGEFHLGVHIADVSHYVKPGSSLDNEAAKRSNSVYFPGHVLPMLPHELSSNLCSLQPDVNRLTVSVLMKLDQSGTLLDYKIVKSVICSKKRFSYSEAKQILNKKKKSKYYRQLSLMTSLCHLLKKKRYERGCIEFAFPDIAMHLSEDGQVDQIDLVEYDITHQLVEEFMLLANEVVATHLSKNGKPMTFRIHEEPNPETIREFAHTASQLGFKISASPSTEELQKLFDEARQEPIGQFLATAFIRSMKLASYSTQNIGHYGLGLEHYTHFTSPIRRYIDLIVHRVLFNEIDAGQNLETIALECSAKERSSAKAEQSVLHLKKLRYLKALQQQGHTQFKAVIVSIKPFGVFFELKELMYEGFLPKSQHTHHIGDAIEVRLSNVDLVTRQTEWTLISQFHTKKTKRTK